MQSVGYVAHHAKIIPTELKTHYEFRAKAKAPWLQKACFWILGKLGAYAVSNTVTVERHSIDGKEFLTRLQEQQDNLFDYFGHRPSQLLIGGGDFQKLMGEARYTSQVFELQSEYMARGSVYGLTVKIIPWMKGMVVMP